MEELPEPRNRQDVISRRTLSEKERRDLLEKRIDDLRRRKRAEKRASRGPLRRMLLPAFLLAFFFLCLLCSLLTLGGAGGSESLATFEIPASNLEDISGRAAEAGSIVSPDIPATAALLLDPATGDVLYEKNADLRLPMASTTKIMTAVVALENASLQESITVSDYAVATGESSAWLEKGEALTVEQLLYALLVQSANDAAVTLAEGVAGSEDSFVQMMNDKAGELGLENSHFANPHGLDEEGHYTCARDLAELAAYAMNNQVFREIVKSSGYELPWPGHPNPRVFANHNKLLNMYPYATGIKTGYTNKAGKCLVASAQKQGRELVSAILNGGESYWDQTIRLMDYGFDDFVRVEYACAGESLAVVKVGDFPRREVNAMPEQSLIFTMRLDNLDGFDHAEVYCREWVPYPVEEDQELGYIIVGKGTPYERREVLASESRLAEPGPFTRILGFIAAVFGSFWRGIKWLIPGL